MSLWKYLITGVASAALGASAAVGIVYFAADPLLGETIDERVAPQVSRDASSAQEDMAQVIGRLLARAVLPRIEDLEEREFTVRIGFNCPYTFDAAEVLTADGRFEPICVVVAP